MHISICPQLQQLQGQIQHTAAAHASPTVDLAYKAVAGEHEAAAGEDLLMISTTTLIPRIDGKDIQSYQMQIIESDMHCMFFHNRALLHFSLSTSGCLWEERNTVE